MFKVNNKDIRTTSLTGKSFKCYNATRSFNPFHATILFLYSLKISENWRFLDFLMFSGGVESGQ